MFDGQHVGCQWRIANLFSAGFSGKSPSQPEQGQIFRFLSLWHFCRGFWAFNILKDSGRMRGFPSRFNPLLGFSLLFRFSLFLLLLLLLLLSLFFLLFYYYYSSILIINQIYHRFRLNYATKGLILSTLQAWSPNNGTLIIASWENSFLLFFSFYPILFLALILYSFFFCFGFAGQDGQEPPEGHF